MRLLRLLVISGALALSAPAFAPAQGTTNAVYGGSTVQTPGRPDPLSFVFSRSAQGAKVLVQPSGHYTCQDGQRALGNTIVADAQPDGSYDFSEDSTGQDPSTGETFAANLSGSGKVTPSKVVGKLRGTLTIKDAQGNVTDQCDTGELSYTLHRKGIQAGGSDQKDPVVIGVRPKRAPRYFLINYQTPGCAPNGSFASLSTKVTGIKRGHKGAFSAKGEQKFTAPSGSTFDVVYKLAGRVKGRRSNGTWKAVVNVTDASGKPALTNCATGTIPWQTASG